MKLTLKIPLAILLLGITLQSRAQNNPPGGCVTATTNCVAYPTSYGGVSYDFTNICAGGGITPPTLTSSVAFGGYTQISYDDSCNNTNWSVYDPTTYTSGPLYWVPPIPSSFPACGVYYYMPYQDGNPNASGSGCVVLTEKVGNNGQGDRLTVVAWSGQVDAVDWNSDWTPFYNYTTDFAGDGTTTFSRPVWQRSPAVNWPVIQPQGERVGLTVTINVCPTWSTYTLIGLSSEPGLCFTNANITPTGADQAVAVQASVPLRTGVDTVEASIDWYVVPTGSSTWCSAGASGPHTIYVTWGSPSTYTGNTATWKRIDEVCYVAEGAGSEPAIGDDIGPQATGQTLGPYSIFRNATDPYYLSDAWTVLDGMDGDCGTMSTLMKQELDLLGATGSAVKFVYARLGPDNSGWSGLVQDSPPLTTYYVFRIPGNYSTRLGYVANNGFNNYEGCCLFQGQYWMGGEGTSETTAAGVLHHVADPNTSASGRHQCYFDQQDQYVPYPNPPEPTY